MKLLKCLLVIGLIASLTGCVNVTKRHTYQENYNIAQSCAKYGFGMNKCLHERGYGN